MSKKLRLIDAGFVDTILISQRYGGAVKQGYDLRIFDCQHCGAPGMNTMMGTLQFTCGAEVHPDGTESEPCPKIEEPVT